MQVVVLAAQAGLLLTLRPFLDEHNWKLPVKLLAVCVLPGRSRVIAARDLRLPS
jgi:hypothetical protein